MAWARFHAQPLGQLAVKCQWCVRRRTVKVDEVIGVFDRGRTVNQAAVLDCRDKRLRREGTTREGVPRPEL